MCPVALLLSQCKEILLKRRQQKIWKKISSNYNCYKIWIQINDLASFHQGVNFSHWDIFFVIFQHGVGGFGSIFFYCLSVGYHPAVPCLPANNCATLLLSKKTTELTSFRDWKPAATIEKKKWKITSLWIKALNTKESWLKVKSSTKVVQLSGPSAHFNHDWFKKEKSIETPHLARLDNYKNCLLKEIGVSQHFSIRKSDKIGKTPSSHFPVKWLLGTNLTNIVIDLTWFTTGWFTINQENQQTQQQA